jgi:hypothetical protein
VSFVAIGLFVATIGYSIGLDADFFRDVAGADVSGAARACRRISRKLGRPERHTAARGLAVVPDAARARLATSDDPALPLPSPLMRLVARQ